MRELLFSIRTHDSEQATRGRLLKGAALLIGIGGLLSIPLVINYTEAPAIPLALLIFEVLICALAFAMAHYGYVRAGALILIAVMVLVIPITSPPQDLVEGRFAVVFVIHMLMAGLVIGANAALALGLLGIAEIALTSLLNGIPWSVWTYATVVCLTVCTGLLWLLIRTQSGWAAYARRQADAAHTAQQDLAAREQALMTTNQELTASNARMETLLRLVHDLETPTIPLLEGVLLVPLVGHLDTRRAAGISQAVLNAISQQRIQTVIIDITGISIVDTEIVQRIEQLARSAQLLGARTILTGISAPVAQAIVANGLNLAGIQTMGRLQDGVAGVLAEMGGAQPARRPARPDQQRQPA